MYFSFALAYALVVLTPGPNLAIVVQSGLAGSRGCALASAAGAAMGAMVLSSSVMAIGSGLPLGRNMVWGMSLAYSLCLIWMGLRSLRRVGGPERPAPMGCRAGFGRAFATAVCNPMTALFMVTAAIGLPGLSVLQVAPTVLALAGGWLMLVALCVTGRWLWSEGGHLLRQAEPVIGMALIGCGIYAMAFQVLA